MFFGGAQPVVGALCGPGAVDAAQRVAYGLTYSSTNNAQTGSSSVCVENIADTITADGTVTFP